MLGKDACRLAFRITRTHVPDAVSSKKTEMMHKLSRKHILRCCYSSQVKNVSSAGGKDNGSVPGVDLETEEYEATLRTLARSLSGSNQKVLLDELNKIAAAEAMKEAEEKLASMRWRSKFGRPSSVPPLGADPTGTYCEIPQDWLEEKVAEKRKPGKPSGAELWQLALFNSFPFIGFGFLDNFIMIMAGDYIDLTIGATLGISTLAAAALGNTISDLAGIGSAWYVENIAARIGAKPPSLSQEQLEMPSSLWSANIGRGFGVVLGCILGMFPLLFLPSHDESETTTEMKTSTEKSKEDLK